MKKSTQPLSYQTHEYACWVTSVMNGLLILKGKKERIPTLAYRLLHTVLTNEGVISSGPHRNEWKIVMDAVAKATGLSIKVFYNEGVENKLKKMTFKDEVAVCDTESGTHTVLISGKSNHMLEGFDPDWENVREEKSEPNRLFTYPDGNERNRVGSINFRVLDSHFFAVKPGLPSAMRMGPVDTRTMIVMKRR